MSDVLHVRHRGSERALRPGDVATIGSDPTATITVSHPGVSKMHGRILFESGAWWYRDDGSTNGSFTSGTRIESVVVDASITVLLGHDVEGEPVELDPEVTSRVMATPGSLRRIEMALWVIAGAAVAGVIVSIAALVAG